MKSGIEWEQNLANQVLSGAELYISYNPQTSKGPYTELANALTGGETFKDGEETALYVRTTGEWLILEGDFRKEYEEAFPSLEKCRKVYQDNIAKRSSWSTD